MVEKIKFPNPYNSGRGRSFCKNAKCEYMDKCAFAFNSIKGGREMRLDFNLCNLNCILCWSNNNSPYKDMDADSLMSDFIHCISRKNEYLKNRFPAGVNNESAFNVSGLQLVGGEPLLSKERFRFIHSFLQKINNYIESNTESCSYLKFNRKGKFKIKLFTNAIKIGEGVIESADLLTLDNLKHLDIRLLLSLKGFNSSETSQLQVDKSEEDIFNSQVKALKTILSLPLKNITLEPVLGFYHSADFNIKTPTIAAEKMFKFDVGDPISKELQQLLKCHINRKGKIFVEPVHSVPQNKKGKKEFYAKFSDYLEISEIIEPQLKGGSRKDMKVTQLNSSI